MHADVTYLGVGAATTMGAGGSTAEVLIRWCRWVAESKTFRESASDRPQVAARAGLPPAEYALKFCECSNA